MDEVLTYPKWLFDTEVGQYTYLLRNTPIGKQENAPTQILKNAQAYILWDLLGNTRLMRMIENESVNGKKAFTVVELMDGLHKNIFGITERGGIPNVMERSLQKNFLDALLTAAAEPEAVKKSTRRLQMSISCLTMPLLSAAVMQPNNGHFAKKTEWALHVCLTSMVVSSTVFLMLSR